MEQIRWGHETAADPLANLVNTESEQALLGAIFRDNRAFEHVADMVRPEDFGFALHGRIFDAVGKLVGSGSVANPVTLKNMFAADDALTAAGGPRYLIQLAASAVTVINCRGYAERIADLAQRREIILAAQAAIADAAGVDPERQAETVLDEPEQRLFEIGERKTIPGGPAQLGSIVYPAIARI